MKKIVLLMLAFILAACSTSGKTDLEKNLAKWNEANISHYRYSLFISCFCPFMEDMPIVIEVKNDEIVSMTSAKGIVIDSTSPLQELLNYYSTIDRVFLKLETDQAGDADEVAVTYDPAYGFPSNVAVDYIKEAVDDEISYQISKFEILE